MLETGYDEGIHAIALPGVLMLEGRKQGKPDA
jgi:hypothetical protein